MNHNSSRNNCDNITQCFYNFFLFLYRIDCLDKVQHRSADFLAVDPEDMYVSMKMPDQDFSVFQEIRTKEEPDGKYT